MGRSQVPQKLSIDRQRAARGWLAAVLLLVCAGAQAARLFVYELPDGSRLVTDHAINSKDYRLVRSGESAKNLGQLAAARTPEFFRSDTSTYDALIQAKAREHQVDFALVKAIVHVESSFNPYAISHRGARGLMQLLPETAKRHGIFDIYDPAQNIEAGIRHLKYLTGLFGNKNHLVLAAYNAGENAVLRYGGIPPYTETQLYVRKVLLMKREYGKSKT
jgi:soluble lytic murein transglycosylase-like protein